MSVDVGQFRRAMGRFATGVCVVTARERDVDHAMTANAVASISLEPLLVLVSVEVDARFHDAVTTAGSWGLSILDDGSRAVAEWFATRGRPVHDQLARTPHHHGQVTGVALLDHALATLECRTEAMYPAGDHSLFLGRVVGVGLGPDGGHPLIYHRSSYRRLA